MLRNEDKLRNGLDNGWAGAERTDTMKKHRLYCKIPMNLQVFAEGDGTGGGSGSEGNANTGQGSMSFDDFLKEEGNQAEFDRRVQKAIHTALTNEKEKWEALTDDKLSEADKLAKMTKDEKNRYLQQKKEKELADRENEITRKELKAEAKNTLAGNGIPTELADILDYSDAETCQKSMNVAQEAFRKAVEQGVAERLKGKDTMKKAPEGDKALEEQIYAYMKGR